jgi:hypothetical protein
VTGKRLILIASVPLVIVVTLGVLALLPPDDRPGVTKANFDRIEKWMTKAQVEEIFGREGRREFIGIVGGGGIPYFLAGRR